MTGQLTVRRPFHDSVVASILRLKVDYAGSEGAFGLERLGELLQETMISDNHDKIIEAFMSVATFFGVESCSWVKNTRRSLETQRDQNHRRYPAIVDREALIQPFPGNI